MARKHSDLPKLFQRTAHGNYYFRRMTGNKRITINTGTGDLNAAKKFLRNYLSGEKTISFAVQSSRHIHQVATAIAQSVVGQTIERTLLSETFDTWIHWQNRSVSESVNVQRQVLIVSAKVAKLLADR